MSDYQAAQQQNTCIMGDCKICSHNRHMHAHRELPKTVIVPTLETIAYLLDVGNLAFSKWDAGEKKPDKNYENWIWLDFTKKALCV